MPVFLFGIGFVVLIIILWPLPETIANPSLHAPVTLLDRNGRVLYEVRQEDFGSQKPLTLAEIPEEAQAALIATEDRTFYEHMGISLRGIGRAMMQNLQAGEIVSGGSTLTQQLVRMRLNPAHRTLFYKLWEMLLALKLDAVLSKEEILEQYWNAVYFGHQAYGLRSAARTYFDKEPQELSTAEIALLIGIVQSPVSLDPFENREGALTRRGRVLTAMRENAVITAEQEEDALREPLHLTLDRIGIEAAHFSFWALEQSEESEPGAEIRTTLDLDLQAAVEDIVARKLEELREKNATSAAVVVLDAHNGDILSMVGSADYFDESHDGAVNVAISARQPGSSLKPFTYALALANGDTAATTVADIDLHLLTEEGNPYTPRNYDYDLHGLVRYREALANSYNIAAVKVLERVGVPRLLDFLRVAGITTLTREPEFYGLALTLGSGEVRLLELAEAYGIFARGGTTLHARALLESPVEEGKSVLDPRIAWIITHILSDASARLPEFGDDTPLSVSPHIVAAKTGTTRNARDNWVVGYTPDRIVGVWVGNADNTPMKGTSGITGAGPIFHDVMEAALRNVEPKPFPRPSGIVTKEVCTLSGKLPTPVCPHSMVEVFVAGTEPTEPDDVYRTVEIDRRTGLLAGSSCPKEFVLKQTFTLFPEETRAWAREHGYREPPTEYSPLCGSADAEVSDSPTASLTITRPNEGDSFLLDPLIPDDQEKVTFEARAARTVSTVEWFIDGEPMGIGKAPDYRVQWRPTLGHHFVEATAGEFKTGIRIEILKP